MFDKVWKVVLMVGILAAVVGGIFFLKPELLGLGPTVEHPARSGDPDPVGQSGTQRIGGRVAPRTLVNGDGPDLPTTDGSDLASAAIPEHLVHISGPVPESGLGS